MGNDAVRNLAESSKLVERSSLVEVRELTRFRPNGGTVFWRSAKDHTVSDVDGNQYIDFTSAFGACLLGHSNPTINQAVGSQLETLPHTMGELFPCSLRVEAAELILQALGVSPVEWDVAFAVSGSDSVDLALKTCILATGKHRFLSFARGFHGQSLGALSVTAHEQLVGPFRPLAGRSTWLRYPETDADVKIAIDAVRDELSSDGDSENEYAGVIYEPILGAGGYLPGPKRFHKELADLCKEFDVPLISDEIFCGFGRSGSMSISMTATSCPDIACFGKSIANGFQIAVAVINRRYSKYLESDSLIPLHGSTFAANPLSLAALIATIKELEKDETKEKISQLSADLCSGLKWLQYRHKDRISIRGSGLMFGVELGSRRQSDLVRTSKVVNGLLEKGYIAIQTGLPYANVVGLAPPFTVGSSEVDGLVSALDGLLGDL